MQEYCWREWSEVLLAGFLTNEKATIAVIVGDCVNTGQPECSGKRRLTG